MLAFVLIAGLARAATFDRGGVIVLQSLDQVSRGASSGRIEATVTSSAEGHAVRLTATGAKDAAGRADLTMHLEDVGGGVLRMIADGDKGWVRLRPALVRRYGGRHWVGFSAVEPTAAFGFSGDPTQLLDDLAKLGGNVPRRVGKATVRGVATTRYRVDLTGEDIGRVLPAPQANAFRSTLDGATGRADVWVDAERVPRRVELRIGTSGFEVVSRMEMYDYGAPIVVTIPTESDTVPASSAQEAVRLARAA